MSHCTHPAYATMLRLANRPGFCESYLTDVTVHDAEALERRGDSVPFTWVVGDSGSHLMFHDEEIDADDEKIVLEMLRCHEQTDPTKPAAEVYVYKRKPAFGEYPLALVGHTADDVRRYFRG